MRTVDCGGNWQVAVGLSERTVCSGLLSLPLQASVWPRLKRHSHCARNCTVRRSLVLCCRMLRNTPQDCGKYILCLCQ